MYSHIMYRLWMDATAQIVQSKAAAGYIAYMYVHNVHVWVHIAKENVQIHFYCSQI